MQCDEGWSFCYSKQKNVPPELRGVEGIGSIWTWTAIDADTRLIVSWLASDRSIEAANALVADLKSRTMLRLQISTDGLPLYLEAILHNFNFTDVHHAEVVKTFAANNPNPSLTRRVRRVDIHRATSSR